MKRQLGKLVREGKSILFGSEKEPQSEEGGAQDSSQAPAERADFSVSFLQCLDALDGTFLVRGVVRVESGDEALLSSDFALEAQDEQGADITVKEAVVLGDYAVPSTEVVGATLREHTFSLRVPKDSQYLVLVATAKETGRSVRHIVDAGMIFESMANAQRVTCCADKAPDYESWFLSRRPTPGELDVQRSKDFADGPLFSLVVPLYETPLAYLEELVSSVLNQTYAKLELVLVNASPLDLALSARVDQLQYEDDRVRVVTLEENLGITENTNYGIEAATGDFICFVDHDDFLEPDILFRYATTIQDHPDADLLYCDEDKYLDGHFVCPYLKPDWNLDLLRSFNYICHMLTVRASLLKSFEVPTREYDGGQDYRVAFLAAEQARSICHVPGILYHWRIHPASTASGSEAKSYTTDIGVRVVQEHLDRMGVQGTVSPRPGFPNMYEISYDIPDNPLVSIVIANKDSVPILDQCIRSIEDKSTYDDYEIIVVENNSTDEETFAYYDRIGREFDNVRVVTCETEGRLNISRVNNTGVAAARGEYVLILNNDVMVITPNWIEGLLGPCLREDVGAVGAKLLYPDDVIQHAGVIFHFHSDSAFNFHGPDNLGQGFLMGTTEDYYHTYQVAQDISACSSACLMTSKKLYEEVGGFDELLPSDYNDVDYCLKLRKKDLLVMYEPHVELYHYESISRPGHTQGAARVSFMRANGVLMQRYPEFYVYGDPYMNPLLAGKFKLLRRD